MAEIILGLGASHGAQTHIAAAQWPLWGAKDKEDPRFDYEELLAGAKPGMEAEITSERMEERAAAVRRAHRTMGAVVSRMRPDVIVIIGDDQKEQFLDDNMPMFAVYRGTAPMPKKRSHGGNAPAEVVAARKAEGERLGGGRTTFEPAPDLAEHVIGCLVQDEFDIACSNEIKPEVGLGHAFSNICRNIPAVGEFPILPVMVNTFYPPNQPTPKRAYALGRALRDAIASWDADKTVAVMASGGLSHQILDPALDETVLDALMEKKPDALFSLPREKLQLGTSEILNWVVAAGTLEGMDMTLVDYIQGYRSMAGTGTGLAFAYWTQPGAQT